MTHNNALESRVRKSRAVSQGGREVPLNIKGIKEFIERLHEVEYDSEWSGTLELQVRYVGDENYSRGWSLPKGGYILQDGLRDPGFGSGPVKFQEIDSIRVPGNSDRQLETAATERYRAKSEYFLKKGRGD